jgi:hypothetical protein
MVNSAPVSIHFYILDRVPNESYRSLPSPTSVFPAIARVQKTSAEAFGEIHESRHSHALRHSGPQVMSCSVQPIWAKIKKCIVMCTRCGRGVSCLPASVQTSLLPFFVVVQAE